MKKRKPTGRRRRPTERAIEPPAVTPEESEAETPLELEEPEDATGFWRSDPLTLLGLGLLATIPYLPALWSGFVWDDITFTEDPWIHSWSGLWSIWLSPADLTEPHYWPVVYTTFWLEHKLWGLAPFGYHLVNILLHAANVVLVWRLLLILAVPGAWVVTAVFAVHPLHVESVAWVIARKDMLSGLFYLAAVLWWLRFTEAPRAGRYGLALGLYAVALLSKSIAVSLPATLLILQWWQQGKVTKSDWLRVAPFFGVGLCITAVDLSLYASQSPVSLGYSLPERLLIASRALWFYVGKLLWPAELAVIYPLWDIRLGDAFAWGYAVAVIAMAVLLWASRRRFGRGPLAGAAFFAVTLSPALGFVDHVYMGFSFVADRFQYLAGLGIMAVVVGGFVRARQWMPNASAVAARGLVTVILLILGTLTWRQAGIYRDEFTLFSHVIAANREALVAHHNLARWLTEAGRLEEALAASREAVKQQPRWAKAHQGLGTALVMLGRFDEAEASFLQGIEIDPRDPEILHNMGTAFGHQDRYEEAIRWYRKALSIAPDYAPSQTDMAVSLLKLRRYDEAAQFLTQILSRRPDGPIAGRLNLILGRALRKLGRLDDATVRFLRAARLEPHLWRPLLELADLRRAQKRFDEADAYRRRIGEPVRAMASLHGEGRRHNERGRYEEAAELYRLALTLDPAFELAQAGMVAALHGLERHEAAIDLLARSAALRPETPATAAWHVLMGLSLQGLGRSAEAVAHYERAVEADPSDVQAVELLAGWRFRAARYDEAVALYQTLLDAGHAKAQTHANVGAALYRLNRPDEALRSFERALSLDPSLETARAGVRQLQEMSRHEVLPAE